jgi:hypothetical protein
MAENNIPDPVAGYDGFTEEERANLSATDGATPDRPDLNPAATGANRTARMYQPRGESQEFDYKNYKFSQLSYPSDLFHQDYIYGGNYVVFYINVHEDSKLFNEGKDINGNPVEFVDASKLSPRDTGQLTALNLTTNELVGTVAAESLIGGTVAGQVTGQQSLGLGGAALNTAGAYVVGNSVSTASRQTKRLRTAIALHTPNQLQIRYSSTWSEEDTSMFAVTQGVGGEIINAIKTLGKDSDFTSTAGAAAANVFLSKSPNAGAVSVATGLAANPKKEQAFKGVDFRTFTYDYQFFPRSEKEAENVLNIIKQFKYHMHPEMKDSRNFVYLYPSEFDIYYYKNSRENLNLHRHTSCVLTDFNVNYTPNGNFNTFPNGMPTQINVAMTFKELSLMTKEKIKDGM